MSRDKGKPCARCGVMRKPTRSTATICQDCRYVLSKSELSLWEPRVEKKEAA